MSDGMRVLAEQCATCIFRPGNLMRLRPGRLRDMVDQCERRQGFVICHETTDRRGGRKVAGPGATGAVCRGYFDRFDTQWLQIARRLGLVVEVTG
jgi:hypothetical protein